jgi:hypothetical protein
MKLKTFVKGWLVGNIILPLSLAIGSVAAEKYRERRRLRKGFLVLHRVAGRLNRLENIDAWRIVVGCQLLVVAEQLGHPEVETIRKRLEAERI